MRGSSSPHGQWAYQGPRSVASLVRQRSALKPPQLPRQRHELQPRVSEANDQHNEGEICSPTSHLSTRSRASIAVQSRACCPIQGVYILYRHPRWSSTGPTPARCTSPNTRPSASRAPHASPPPKSSHPRPAPQSAPRSAPSPTDARRPQS